MFKHFLRQARKRLFFLFAITHLADRSIRLAQDLSLLTKKKVIFTDGATTVTTDGTVAINKNSAAPIRDVSAVMKRMGMTGEGNADVTTSAKNEAKGHTYESLNQMSNEQVSSAYADTVSQYAKSLKQSGFTNEQVQAYLNEAMKTKNVKNQRSSIVLLQEEMGADEQSKVGGISDSLNVELDSDKITVKPAKIKKSKIDYRKVFFDQYPETKGEVVVHHAIEQRVLNEFNEVACFTPEEINVLNNLRGIPNGINPDIHLSKIRIEWNRFYRVYPNPTREQFYQKVIEIDEKFGHMFNPQITINRGKK